MVLTSIQRKSSRTTRDLVKTFYVENLEPSCPPYGDMFAYLDDAINELGNISIRSIEDKMINSPIENGGRIFLQGIERIAIYQRRD